MDVVAGASREMARKAPHCASGIRARGGFPRQIGGSRRHPKGRGPIGQKWVDQIRRKASLAMDRPRVAPLCLTLIDNAHGEIHLQSARRPTVSFAGADARPAEKWAKGYDG
jgi:hypothetical protein